MKTISTAILTVLLLTGCGEDDQLIIPSEYTEVVSYGSVEDYNASNSSNRVNIFVDIGQSNSQGPYGVDSISNPNVFTTVEATQSYPNSITIETLTNSKTNKAQVGFPALNTAFYVGKNYAGSEPLIIVNASVGGTGVHYASQYNFWSINRKDTDSRSLHKQTIHYLNTLVNQLQSEGKEPYVVGVNWNQWESEAVLEDDEVYNTYMTFFDTLESVIPNDDYKLFICNPTANLKHREKFQWVFNRIATDRTNTYIYYPDEMGYANVFYDGLHYPANIHNSISEYILNLI